MPKKPDPDGESMTSIAKVDVGTTIGQHSFLDRLRAAKGKSVDISSRGPEDEANLARRKQIRELFGTAGRSDERPDETDAVAGKSNNDETAGAEVPEKLTSEGEKTK